VLVVVADRLEQICDVMVMEAVVGVPAGAADGNEPCVPQQPQLVRGGAGRQPGQLDQFLDRSLMGKHCPEQAQTAAGSEGSHRLGERFSLVGRERMLVGAMFRRVGHDATLARPAEVFIRVRYRAPVRRCASLPLAAAAALAAPSTAAAHGIHASAASSVPEFIWLGFRHMIAGWDHLLFAAGIVLLAGSGRRAAKLISLFVAGHSLTLLLAALAGWRVDAALVDVVIALSVAYVGLRLLHGRPDRWMVTSAAIFGFGLVHGLGLATRLQAIHLPGGGALVARVLAFNIGVELGQLAALSVLVTAAMLGARALRAAAAPKRVAGALLTAVGLLAGATLGFAAANPSNADDVSSVGRGVVAGGCVEQAQASSPSPGGEQPERSFYEPGEAPSEGDLGHVLGDGFIVVRYRESLGKRGRAAMAEWSRTGGAVVAPARSFLSSAFEAVTTKRTLSCRLLDLDTLDDFRASWFAERRSGSTG